MLIFLLYLQSSSSFYSLEVDNNTLLTTKYLYIYTFAEFSSDGKKLRKAKQKAQFSG